MLRLLQSRQQPGYERVESYMGEGSSLVYWINRETGDVRYSEPEALPQLNGWIIEPAQNLPEGASIGESWFNPSTGERVGNPYAGPLSGQLPNPPGPFDGLHLTGGGLVLAVALVPGEPDMAWRYTDAGGWFKGPRYSSGGLGDLIEGALGVVFATAGFGVGGTTGAALATGQDSEVIEQTLVADAAGLAAGVALSSALGAAGATGSDIGAGALVTEPAAAATVAEEAAALGIVETAAAPAVAAGTVTTATAGAALPAAVTKVAQTAIAAVQAAAGQLIARELAPAREPALIAPAPREPALPLLPLLALAGLAAFAFLR